MTNKEMCKSKNLDELEAYKKWLEKENYYVK